MRAATSTASSTPHWSISNSSCSTPGRLSGSGTAGVYGQYRHAWQCESTIMLLLRSELESECRGGLAHDAQQGTQSRVGLAPGAGGQADIAIAPGRQWTGQQAGVTRATAQRHLAQDRHAQPGAHGVLDRLY